MKMTKRVKMMAVAAMVILPSTFALRRATATTGYTNASLNGTFVTSLHGLLAAPAGFDVSLPAAYTAELPTVIPAATLSLTKYYGDGTCSFTTWYNYGGIATGPDPDRGPQPPTHPTNGESCTYQVNPDGSGTTSVVTAGSPPLTVTFVIIDANHFNVLLNVEQYGVASGTAVRQGRPQDEQ